MPADPPRRYRNAGWVNRYFLPTLQAVQSDPDLAVAVAEQLAAFEKGRADYERGVYQPPKGTGHWAYHRGHRMAEHDAFVAQRDDRQKERSDARKAEAAKRWQRWTDAGAAAWRRGCVRAAPQVDHTTGDRTTQMERKYWRAGYDQAKRAFMEEHMRPASMDPKEGGTSR